MSSSGNERFIADFAEAWARADSSGFAALWHEDGTLIHPSLGSPIRGSEVPRWSERIKAALPGFTFEVDEWAAQGEVVFLEWTTTATVDGRSLRWSGVDRFRLRAGRIAEEVVFFDTLTVWAALDPSMARPPLLEVERSS